MVTLIGAGPGDSGLITVKGAKKLMEADIVLYDRLVGEDIIAMIPEAAEKIDVGKNSGNHTVPQQLINELLLTKGRQGLNVVRLKGGDPYVFGRGGEELMLLAENNIAFEVVPGISAAVAGGAYAGIPVTHRDFTSSLHIITGHAKADETLNIDYESLIRLNGTLVFMMGVSSLGEICRGLVNAGMERSMPAAIVENATLLSQRKFTGTIETLPVLAKENKILSPAVIIIGNVCTLSGKLDWFSKKPLFGKKVMVTRSRNSASDLSARLKELGCFVVEAPCIRTVPLTADNSMLENCIKNISDYSWLVFTSSVGVNIFFDYLINNGVDIRRLSRLKIAAVGSETEKEICRRGIFTDFIPKQFNGRELATGLLPFLKENDRVILAGSKKGFEDIMDIFTSSCVSFDNISIYDTLYNDNQNLAEMLSSVDLVAFTSSSTVDGFINSFPDADHKSITGLCIGEKTAARANKHGIKTIVSDTATISGMLEKIIEIWA